MATGEHAQGRAGRRRDPTRRDAGSQRYQVHLPPQHDGTTRLPTTVAGGPDEQAYVRTTIATRDGRSLVESYRVEGMGHVWPGPSGEGLFTDHAGPDASAIVWDFARRHPRGSLP